MALSTRADHAGSSRGGPTPSTHLWKGTHMKCFRTLGSVAVLIAGALSAAGAASISPRATCPKPAVADECCPACCEVCCVECFAQGVCCEQCLSEPDCCGGCAPQVCGPEQCCPQGQGCGEPPAGCPGPCCGS